MRKSFKKALSLVLSAAMTLSLASGVTFPQAAAEDTTEPVAGVATASGAVGSYKAMVGFQTSVWDCRDGVDSEAADKLYNEQYLPSIGKEAPAYNGANIYLNGKVASVNAKTGELSKPENAVLYEGAEVIDAAMTEDGEYTISISKLNLVDEENAEKIFNMLYVSTNIPVDEANANVVAKASSVKIDGVEVAKDIAIPHKGDIEDYYRFMIADVYAPGDGTDSYFYGNPSDDADAKALSPVPSESIEITFSIEGVDWSTAPLPNATTAPGPSATPEPSQAAVTPPPEVSIAPFDIYVASNVNDALSPDEGIVGTDGKAIQAGVFASKEVKAKIDAAKNSKNEPVFSEGTTTYFETDTASATISKTGAYTLSLTARGNCDDLTNYGAIWLPVLINNSSCNMPTDFNLVGKEISVTSAENTTETKTYNWSAQLMQDSEKNVRLSVCNQWAANDAEKAASNTIKDVIPVKKGDTISFTFYVTADAPAPISTPTPAAISTAAATSYNGYLGFQTDNWAFRNIFQDADYGLKSKYLDYKTEIGYWDASQKPADSKQCAKQKVTITDTTMTDNNVVYTATIKGLNLQTLKGADPKDVVSTAFNMLFISTDIPLAMQGVKMKDATLKIDGNVVKEYTVVPCKGDASGYYQFMLADGYAPSDGTKDAAYPSGDLLKTLPTDSIEISYKMEGVDFDRHEIGYAKGKTFSVGNFKYKVTKTAVQSGENTPSKGAVKVVGLSKKGKKKTSVSLGKTTKVASAGAIATYKVTSIKKQAFKNSKKLKKANLKKATNVKNLPAKAFYNCKKLTTVTLNSKMKKLPAGVFQGCKKLKTLTLNAKLKSVNKTAFKKCSKKIKIKGKSKAANKKKIKKVYKKVK